MKIFYRSHPKLVNVIDILSNFIYRHEKRAPFKLMLSDGLRKQLADELEVSYSKASHKKKSRSNGISYLETDFSTLRVIKGKGFSME